MGNKELVDFVNNDLPSDGEWWCDGNKDKFHEACGTMMAYGMNNDTIKELLSNLYSAVSSEYGY
jgi:hypothetical protein